MDFIPEANPTFVQGINYCNLCDRHFSSKFDRDFHLIETHNVIPCDICDYCFPTVLLYKMHLKDTHSLMCLICNAKLFDDQQLHEHMQLFHTFKCGCCAECFQTEELLEKHHKSRHAPIFVQKPNRVPYNISNQIVSNIKPSTVAKITYTCQICKIKLPSEERKNAHLKSAHPSPSMQMQNQLECAVCSKFLKTKTGLREHYRLAHDFKECALCDGIFCTLRACNEHYMFVHCNFKCFRCNNAFTNEALLKNHIKVVHQLKCELCQKVYSTETLLQNHYAYGHATDVKICMKKEKVDIKYEKIDIKNETMIDIKNETMIDIKKEEAIYIKKEMFSDDETEGTCSNNQNYI